MNDHEYVAKLLDGIAGEVDHFTDAEMEEIGHLAIGIITTRTKIGKDVDGNPFTAYSPDYAKNRAEHGYSTRPDLARTGHMLGAMTPVIGKDEVTILFAGALDAVKAAVHNDGSNLKTKISRSGKFPRPGKIPKREFFDIRQEKEIELMENSIGSSLMARIEKQVK